MAAQDPKKVVDTLAKLLAEANKSDKLSPAEQGRCDWTDIEGNPRCNSPWSEFQCQQVGGTFTPGGSC